MTMDGMGILVGVYVVVNRARYRHLLFFLA